MFVKQKSQKLLKSKSLSYIPNKMDVIKEVMDIQKPMTTENIENIELDFTDIYKNNKPIIEMKMETMETISKEINNDREKMLYQNAIKKWRNSAKV